MALKDLPFLSLPPLRGRHVKISLAFEFFLQSASSGLIIIVTIIEVPTA